MENRQRGSTWSQVTTLVRRSFGSSTTRHPLLFNHWILTLSLFSHIPTCKLSRVQTTPLRREHSKANNNKSWLHKRSHFVFVLQLETLPTCGTLSGGAKGLVCQNYPCQKRWCFVWENIIVCFFCHCFRLNNFCCIYFFLGKKD